MEKKFVPVMITPFDHHTKIDLDSLGKLVEFYLAAGVKGLFANCLSSEMFSITDGERIELTRHVVKQVNGRVPVVATGSFGHSLQDKARFTKRIYDTGVDAVILVTSHFAEPGDSDDVLLKNFDTLFNLTGNIPLGMYECPAPYKRIVEADTFKTLLSTNKMVYHKDTSIEPVRVKAKLDIIKETGNKLEFYDAHTPNAIYSLQMGAKGMSSISGNFYPELLVWLVNNVSNPEGQEEVKWLQQEITKVDPLIHIAYPMSSKYFLSKRGLSINQICRIIAHELTPQRKQTLDEIHSGFISWCERLDIKPVEPDQLK
jgi:4-hydroxy-tetrahydrodipicolinate synthase